jgi:hypothetical protein
MCDGESFMFLLTKTLKTAEHRFKATALGNQSDLTA